LICELKFVLMALLSAAALMICGRAPIMVTILIILNLFFQGLHM
jgi:hypothetical protein